MKKIFLKYVTLILLVALSFVFIGCNATNDAIETREPIKVNGIYNEKEISALFDFYDYEEGSTFNRITAYKTEAAADMSELVNVNLSNAERIRIAYDLQYDYDAEIIYLAVSVFDESDNILSVMVADAFPIYYEDGRYDALFDIDGKKVFLSEIQSGEAEDCFFFSLTASLLAAKIAAALIVAAKVTAVVAGVVAIGGITYSVASLTKAKIQ